MAAWDIVRLGRGEPDAGVIQSLIESSLRGDILVPAGDSCHTSLWGAIDRHLRELFVNSANKAAPAFRGAQEKASAVRRIRDARQTRGAEAIVAVYRRYPWAMAVHAGLLEYGETVLRLGHSGLARRVFQDVLTHASDPLMLSRANRPTFAVADDSWTLPARARGRAPLQPLGHRLLRAAFDGPGRLR